MLTDLLMDSQLENLFAGRYTKEYCDALYNFFKRPELLQTLYQTNLDKHISQLLYKLYQPDVIT